MALLRSVDYSIRQTNKEAWLDQYDDLFDQYVESDAFQFGHSNGCDDDLASLFGDRASSDGDRIDFSTIPGSEVKQEDSDDDWQTRLEPLKSIEDESNYSLRSRRSSVYQGSRNNAVASNPELPSLNKPLAHRPRIVPSLSTPASPRRKVDKTSTREIIQPQPSRIIKPDRAGSQSPRMAGTRTAYQGVWAKHIEAAADKLNLRISREDTPYSPPLCANPVTHQDGSQWVDGQRIKDELSSMSTGFSMRPRTQMTPQSSPSGRLRVPHSAPVVAGYNGGFDALQTPPQTNPLPSSPWPSDCAALSDFTLNSPAVLQDGQWWTSTGADRPAAQQSTQHPDIMSLSLNDTDTADLTNGGLLIQCDPTAFQGLTSMQERPIFPQYPYSNIQYSPTAATTPSHLIVRPGERSPSNSPPPPITPTRASRARSRSKSRSYSQHRRSKSISNNAAQPRQESVGFVNFTPDDSKKILGGVAPSGSSKTKARREKEAADKRRRLSLAATRAIVEAGGDPTLLDKEGLFAGYEE